MSASAVIPWADVIGFGLGVLRLEPRAFWALTLPELRALARAGPGAGPLGGPDLARLMARYPDYVPQRTENKETGHG